MKYRQANLMFAKEPERSFSWRLAIRVRNIETCNSILKLITININACYLGRKLGFNYQVVFES
jgi:hypothetical protein